MTQEEAQKIADNHLKDFPSREIAMSFGEWRNGYLFSYRKKNPTGGHCGRSLYAHITDDGLRMIEDAKELTDAIVFASEYLRNNS